LFRQAGPTIAVKRPALSVEPSIQVHKLKPNDLLLTFASDYLWEHFLFLSCRIIFLISIDPVHGSRVNLRNLPILQRREIVDYGLNVSRDQRPYVLATNILD